MENKENNANEEKPKDLDLVEQLQRLQAEFENYKKRTEKDQENLKDHIKSQLLIKFLNILDNLERSLAKEDKKATEIVYKQMKKLLEEEQVTQIPTAGQKLDPYKHEVMLKEKGKQDDMITEELQKGYMIKDKVLRPARVKISKTEE